MLCHGNGHLAEVIKNKDVKKKSIISFLCTQGDICFKRTLIWGDIKGLSKAISLAFVACVYVCVRTSLGILFPKEKKQSQRLFEKVKSSSEAATLEEKQLNL